MPYFVYKIYRDKRLVPAQSFQSFKDARDFARSLRSSMTAQDSYTAKVIFAKSSEEAEQLLTQEREYIPHEDD